MSNFKIKLQVLCLALLLPLMLAAQNVRYVKSDGSDSKDGKSWANAKKTVQAAINSLSDNGLTGEVWIAKGTYKPTRSTEASNTSNLYSSFIIPAGIKVYGGFAGTESDKAQRATKKTNVGTFFSNETVLSGNLASKAIAFTPNTSKKEWSVTTYGNSYHVVWFATKGFDSNGKPNAIGGEALLDGCTIEGGYAGNTIASGRPHNAYGGGAYMVDGSSVTNCIFRKCYASRAGGAIYMDGGGTVDNVYVWMSQSVGVGKSYGYGGGICVNGKGSVLHSAVMKCVARFGGGIAFLYDASIESDKFAMTAIATLVNNNMSHTEAGGIYMDGGGLLDNVTVATNQCNGTGANENGVITGRSGGVYIRDHARIYNSVLWGNTCSANKNVQYANSRSSASVEKPVLNYVYLSRNDFVDWSSTVKNNIVSLSTSNVDVDAEEACPNFTNPVGSSGFSSTSDLISYNFKPLASSPLSNAGLQLADIDTGNTLHAVANPKDILNVAFNSRCTIGAYTSDAQQIVATAKKEIFVDPSSKTADVTGGASWDKPALSLADAINAAGDGYKIYVKEGTITNVQSATGSHVRLLSINMKSGVTVLGGFDEELKGTDISRRNPVLYPTVITGNITDDYNYNVMHLVTFDGVKNAVFDGFQLRYGNSNSYTWSKASERNGSAFYFKNASTGNVVRNCLVAGCTSMKGAAVYATGNSSVTFENYIFHNNQTSSVTSKTYGIVQTEAGSSVILNHGDIIRNAGTAVVNAGNVEINNSVVYANLRAVRSETNKADSYGQDGLQGTGTYSGTNNLFDYKTVLKLNSFIETKASLTFDPEDANYPRFVNSTQNSGVSKTGDVTYYGRTTSWEPLNTNPMTNAALANGDHSLWGTDMSTVTTRDNGGLPDIGAVENHYSTQEEVGEFANPKGQPAYGSVYFVRDYRNEDGTIDYAAGGNGMSWATAINGNAYYYDAEAHGQTERGRVGEGIPSKQNGVLTGTNVVLGNGDNYIMYNGTGFTTTTDIKNATEFNITGTPANGYTIKTTYNGREVNVGYDDDHNLSFNNSSLWKSNAAANANTGTLYFSYNTMVACPTTEDCSICGGTGHVDVDCHTCGGDHQVECTHCDANGKIDCPNCDGGRYDCDKCVDGKVDCPQCIDGQIPCAQCNDGKIACDQCGGKGHPTCTTCWGNKTTTCTTCWGNKTTQCTTCWGAGTTWWNGRTCTNCNGQGNLKCTNCNGQGNLTCTGCNGTGLSTRNCNTCKGTGLRNCYTCNGKGSTNCGACNHKGYTDCSSCNKYGYRNCTVCGGRDVWDRRPTPGSGLINCDVCNGRKQSPCPDCTNGKVPQSCPTTQTCTICNGTGQKPSAVNRYLTVNGLSSTSTNLRFYTKKVTYDEVQGTIGLQFAVNSARDDMSKSFKTRVVNVSEKYVYGTANVTHTYQDFDSDANQEVSVWVGAGTYTSNKGYQIRNHVKVYGGFPKTGTPGMDARHPQLSEGIALSVKNQKLGLKVSDYETILQTHTSIAERDRKTNNVSVLSHPAECRVTTADDSDTPRSRDVYEGAEWDGFTFRYGYRVNAGGRNGGAGVQMYENVVLRNCVIRDNKLADGNGRTRGGGVYCDGSSVINCYIMNNEGAGSSDTYGGGIYMIKGTMYNSVVCGNKLTSGSRQGAGCYFESANFYNNTVVNNTGASTIGVYTASAADAHLTVYNSIIMAEDGQSLLQRASTNTPIGFTNCFLQTNQAEFVNSYNAVTLKNNKEFKRTAAATANPFALPIATANANLDYRIALHNNAYDCVNEGTEDLGKDYDGKTDVELPDNDMDYTDRIKDCTVDIGAYEYNGAYDIAPDLASVAGKAVYYVTPNGHGMASAKDPMNAACADKLQLVLDAAGRYKLANPTKAVIVKLANSKAMAAKGERFTYYANRTSSTDTDNESTREWSILVPHGVELWGGYTDEAATGAWSNTNNGFNKDGKDLRDVTGNPTYLDARYNNKVEDADVITYHVVTFTNNMYDAEGDLLTTTLKGIKDRAVVDGLYITGGQADGMSTSSSVKNINEFGGAAIVTDFAHVRNCIVQDNSANYGGALALTHGALVSGSLIDKNKANYGGGIYVFEDGDVLSDKTYISTDPVEGKAMDAKMPHVYTSTIVNNKAEKLGGGIWYGSGVNVRVNSSVIWQNTSSDQANVAGAYELSKPADDKTDDVIYYPFAYSALQEIKADGKDNISVGPKNSAGTRFATDNNTLAVEGAGDTKFDQFGYFGLYKTSRLCVAGMPLDEYDALVASEALSPADFMNTSRKISKNNTRTSIDIGARALDDVNQPKEVMLRLFVVEEGALDSELATAMSNQTKNAYYSQQGSSFAYPFEGLKAALDYIVSARNKNTTDKANNMPFEICIAGGTYEVTGGRGASFNIPEGVSVYGGFKYDPAAKTFYGRYYKADTDKTTNMTSNSTGKAGNPQLISDNVEFIGGEADADPVLGIQFVNLPINEMLEEREREDANGNNIIEPWEFKNTTILSGNKAKAYHVLSSTRNTSAVGTVPIASVYHGAAVTDPYTPKYVDGKFDQYEGQPIVIDGVTVTGGNATGYQSGSIKDLGINNYYQGGGMLIDGNQEKAAYQQTDVAMAVGRIDIPVTIANCRFEGNTAGYGGAISSNGTLNIFGSIFENNKAMAKSETAEGNSVSYAGQGGAVYATHYLNAYNTVFANNEAVDEAYSITPTQYKFIGQNSTAKTVGGTGGAVFVGKNGYFHIVNCDIVRNQANAYPAVYTMNPETTAGVNASATNYSATYHNQMVNTVAWGNEVNAAMAKKFAGNSYFKFASQLICNYGSPTRNTADYNPDFAAGSAPMSQKDLDDSSKFMETAWFCAYEEGRGVTPNNKEDKREVAYSALTDMATLYSQNSNVVISSQNDAFDGPNFAAPSDKAGIAGYSDGLDWSRARVSDLTDNGSGVMEQNVEITPGGYTMSYNNYGGSGSEVPVDKAAEIDNTDYVAKGYYPMSHFIAKNFVTAYDSYKKYLPLGDDFYMKTAYPVANEEQMNINRICYNPTPAHKLAYIDIGAYEYFYAPLKDVDVLYVSTKENVSNGIPDGSSWKKPTSDLQRAIETLLASRNNKKKEIRIIEGEYAPFNRFQTDEGRTYCFYIDTKDANAGAHSPASLALKNKKIASLMIKGGYSNMLEDSCNVAEFKTVITGRNNSASGCDHLFYINDATQRYGDGVFDASNNYGATNADVTAIGTIPVQFDGLTFVNSNAAATAEGSAIYYKDREADAAKVTATKFVLSKSTFYSNEGKSVVYVGKNGGRGQVYNNVFHDNNCNPISAEYTITVNNTFALNKGQVMLTSSVGSSYIYNSVFWKNNPLTSGYGSQFTVVTATPTTYTSTALKTKKTSNVKNNAFTGGNESLDYTTVLAGLNYNAGLSDKNNDIMYGPNFVDPENEDIASRNFSFATANRLLNKGVHSYFSSYAKDYSYKAVKDTVDIANSPRFVDEIDLGAYEIKSQITRVVYVDPNTNDKGDGTSWEKDDEGNGGPLGIGDLQSAIDNAALYSVLNDNAESYVFVKGSPSTQQRRFDETVTMRNGVNIYGSIPDVYDVCDYESKTPAEADKAIADYAAMIAKMRTGVASPLAYKTIVNGVTSNEGDIATSALLDGFVITNPVSTTAPALSVYGAAGSKVAVRNVIVADNKVSGTGVNVVNINNALLYEALVRNNTTSASALNIGANGYAVNVTVEGKTTGTTANAKNSLVNFSDATAKSFSGVLYKVEDENLNWQLVETSSNIDLCDQTKDAYNPQKFLPAALRGFVDYANDIDLLGNPRLLKDVTSANKVDAGAFETWRIDKDVKTVDAANYYPHEGSVVYIMEDKTLSIGTDNFKPAYLLVKKGASLYGNGNEVNVGYVAVERDIKAGGSLVSMPFSMNYNSDVTAPSVASGILTLAKANAKAYSYNGDSRSDWQYKFAAGNSACWTALSKAAEANNGVLYVPTTAGLYRFTSKAAKSGEFVYTEEEDEEYKTVELVQHNDSEYESKQGNGADFTSKENMGWNCIGMPYLVSDYSTAGSNYGSGEYNMNVPHTLWLYYDGKYTDGTAADGGAGYYSVPSWDATQWHLAAGESATVWVGEGIFTQTATLKDKETLTFYRPMQATSSSAKARNARYYYDGDEEEEREMLEDIASDIKVYVVNNTIRIKNLSGGETVKIFTAGGQMEVSDTAEASEFVAPVRAGVHVVKVNNRTYKVLAR
ncbi:MAG: hypothetical protein MJZ41_02795 [Bacteroidaceae bacterium]|nr:hypothetical protein [Bacteroidaceae bacterium]